LVQPTRSVILFVSVKRDS